MNKTISIIRIALLLILVSAAALLFLGEEQDENELTFLLHVLIDKAAAVALGYTAYRLWRRWIKTDQWLQACTGNDEQEED